MLMRLTVCLLTIAPLATSFHSLQFHFPLRTLKVLAMSASSSSSVKSAGSFPYNEIQRVLLREYTSFFSPMERNYYASDVEFTDPLNSFKGIDKYQANVDMLAGRTTLGRILFEDASIVLHNFEVLPDMRLLTRWTLQVTSKLPWKPRAKFTGVSIYTFNSENKIAKQEDFWDSINLINGQYRTVGPQEGLLDFTAQLKREDGAAMSAPELPYELLRRAKFYEIRRYPAHVAIETIYDKRPEGYDRLGSYAGGSNEPAARLKYYSPTLMKIEDGTGGQRRKTMTWPMLFTIPGQQAPTINDLPEPTIPRVSIVNKPALVVAVLRFEAAATEIIARKCTGDLIQCLKNDGLSPVAEATSGAICTVGQFDALFSLNKRRNEVWVELQEHPGL